MRLTRTAVAVSVALLVAFTAVAAIACTGKVVYADSAKNGKSVALHRGDQLFVSLKGNATTGYTWKILSVKRSVLKPRASAYVPNANPKHLVGVGGVYKLRLKALARGTTVLKLKYARGKELGGYYKLRVVVS